MNQFSRQKLRIALRGERRGRRPEVDWRPPLWYSGGQGAGSTAARPRNNASTTHWAI